MSVFKSRLYDCTIVHSRSHPKAHRFVYRYFTFCIDLDEMESLSQKTYFFGTGRFKIFRFLARDFFLGNSHKLSDLRKEITSYAKSKGVDDITRIEVLGHVRTLGYCYNPACFYFCYGSNDQMRGVILEVTNTFKERKVYWIPAQSAPSRAEGSVEKYFYVSPFVSLDSKFECQFERPEAQLKIQIDSQVKGQTIVHAFLTGKKKTFSHWNLFRCALRYPLVPLRVMGSIHVQALRLYLKGIAFFRKNEFPELQKGGLS